jgi:hypothetical protein
MEDGIETPEGLINGGSDGYIYALQTLKNEDGNPLRLVRFKL